MITLRPATEADLPLMFKWRNQPEVYEGFYQQTRPLTWGEHHNWWYSRPSSWMTFILERMPETKEEKGRVKDIGVINIGQMEHWSPELGWYMGDLNEWRKGYMKEALIQVMKFLKERGYEYCHTTIKMDNERSLHLAYRLGFEMLGGAREGEFWLTRNLTNNYLI